MMNYVNGPFTGQKRYTMIKIKISYETQAELLYIAKMLDKPIKDMKQSDTGKYKKVYVTIETKQGGN